MRKGKPVNQTTGILKALLILGEIVFFLWWNIRQIIQHFTG